MFLCNSWLSLSRGKCQTHRVIPVTMDDNIKVFGTLFPEHANMRMFDEHTWISVFKRPRRSQFTRVQRLSCCLAIIFLCMVTSAMWYDTSGEPDLSSGLKIGPIRLTFREVYVGFASSLIAALPTALMIMFFRRSRSKTKEKADCMNNTNKQKKSIGSKSFPWWCIIFGYILVFASTASGAFFSFLYSLDWGEGYFTAMAVFYYPIIHSISYSHTTDKGKFIFKTSVHFLWRALCTFIPRYVGEYQNGRGVPSTAHLICEQSHHTILVAYTTNFCYNFWYDKSVLLVLLLFLSL